MSGKTIRKSFKVVLGKKKRKRQP